MSNPLAATFLVTVLAFIGIWLIQVRSRDASYIDYYWGPGFLVMTLIHGLKAGFTLATAILTFLVALWALRLTWHMIERHGKSRTEDARYAAMRAAGGASFWWKSLFTIFLLQAGVQWVIASPLHVAFGSAQIGEVSDLLFGFGIALFSAGFAFESIADRQLAQFKESATSKRSLMTTGLWSVSRHPNYLGEILLWFGIGTSVFAMTGSALAFAGPVILAIIMRTVSIPLTEEHLRSTRPAFDAYAQHTPVLLPRLATLRDLAGV